MTLPSPKYQLRVVAWVSPEEDPETEILTQMVYLAGGPRQPEETVPPVIRSLALAIAVREELGDGSLQWGDSVFCTVLGGAPHAWKQRRRWPATPASAPGGGQGIM